MAPSLIHAAALALRASSATICPTSPTCPQDDQCIYTANAVSLQVSCATDYYGGDLVLAQVALTPATYQNALKTDTVDLNTGAMHEPMCFHIWLCSGKLRGPELLLEELADRCATEVRETFLPR